MTALLKIAVIGSNSFSGATFVDYALDQGCDVVGISRSTEPHEAFLPYRWGEKKADFRFYPYDLNHHLDEIMAVITAEKIGHVVNFAAQSMVGESWQNPEHWFRTNVLSTIALHEKLRRLDFLDRYVHVTTPEVYGSTQGFIREDAPFNPSTPYAVSRAAADMSLKTYFEAYGFPVLFTRAANVYGPGQQLYRIIPRTILMLRTGGTLQLQGGGVSRRSFIHMRDVSAATWRIMTQGGLGQTYHIATDEIVSIRALVERLCARLGASFSDTVEVAEERLGKDAAYQLDSGKLRRELNWRARISLDDGLGECVAWIDRHLDALRAVPAHYIHKP